MVRFFRSASMDFIPDESGRISLQYICPVFPDGLVDHTPSCQIYCIGSARGFLSHFPKHLPLFNSVVESLVGVGRWAFEFIGNAA